ncbi:PhzF family phenazine biosynthesis protein [Neisseriaceae bacterium TC5R-5]|nr:PhzF family phenazine biosynthesis protein [Neisseriaceae bacterium TC5R-5]
MSQYVFEIVNVFAETPFGGNPLAVFTDARGLSDSTMQLLARQMNLSETVFLFPHESSAAQLRIFTPSYELPFAGHPTIGSAAVLHRLRQPGDRFELHTNVGPIAISYHAGCYTLQANAPQQRPAGVSRRLAAQMLHLNEADIELEPLWLNTGTEQLLIRLASKQAVLAARPDPALFVQHATLKPGRSIAYLWHQQNDVATVRLFFEQLGAIIEDPGTGSACANLGGWCALNTALPINWRVEQGEAIQRPNVLYLTVDEAAHIYVGGRVQQIGEGVIHL